LKLLLFSIFQFFKRKYFEHLHCDTQMNSSDIFYQESHLDLAFLNVFGFFLNVVLRKLYKERGNTVQIFTIIYARL